MCIAILSCNTINPRRYITRGLRSASAEARRARTSDRSEGNEASNVYFELLYSSEPYLTLGDLPGTAAGGIRVYMQLSVVRVRRCESW